MHSKRKHAYKIGGKGLHRDDKQYLKIDCTGGQLNGANSQSRTQQNGSRHIFFDFLVH